MQTGEGVIFYYINAKCGHFTNLAQAHKLILLSSKVPPNFAKQALALFFIWQTALLILSSSLKLLQGWWESLVDF